MVTNLAVQSFGREYEYRRAILTVLSFYVYTSAPVMQTRVILFTDRPEYFKPFFGGLPIEYVLLTEDKIKKMRGGINFLHRMKIALIEEALEKTEDALIYTDSDSFFIGDPLPLVKQLSPKKSFIHLWEYEMESMREAELPAGQTARAFVRLIESSVFELADGSEVRYPLNSSSWNAGSMMLHPYHLQFIPDVYKLTDQFYPPTLSHASEQYAFSLILQQRTEIAPCDSVIYHYWYRTKKQIIDLFLAERLTANWAEKTLAQKLKEVKGWCKKMPDHFTHHVLTIKDNAIQLFNKHQYLNGYKYALKAVCKNPLDVHFLRDVLYHTKKGLKA